MTGSLEKIVQRLSCTCMIAGTDLILTQVYINYFCKHNYDVHVHVLAHLVFICSLL